MSLRNTVSLFANNDTSPSQSEEDALFIDTSPCTTMPDEKNILSPCLSSPDPDNNEIRGHTVLYNPEGIEESAKIDDVVHSQSREIENVCSQIDLTSKKSKVEHDIDDASVNNSQYSETLLGMDQSICAHEILTFEPAYESNRLTATGYNYKQSDNRNEEDSARGDTEPENCESTCKNSPVSCSDSSSPGKEYTDVNESSYICTSQQESEAHNRSAFRIGTGNNVSKVVDEDDSKKSPEGRYSELPLTSVEMTYAEGKEDEDEKQSDNKLSKVSEIKQRNADKKEEIEKIVRIRDNKDIYSDRENLDSNSDNVGVPAAITAKDSRANESNFTTTTADQREGEHEGVSGLFWRNPRHQLLNAHNKRPFWRQSSDGETFCKAETPIHVNTNYEGIEEQGRSIEGSEYLTYHGKAECTLQNEEKDSLSMSQLRENASDFKISKRPEALPHSDTSNDPDANIASIIQELQRMSAGENSVFENVIEKHEDETPADICSLTDGKSPTEESKQVVEAAVKRPDISLNMADNTREISILESTLPSQSDVRREREMEELKNNTRNDSIDITTIVIGRDEEVNFVSSEKHQGSVEEDKSDIKPQLFPVKETEENILGTFMGLREANETENSLRHDIDSTCHKHVSFCLDECNTVISSPSPEVPLAPNSQQNNEAICHQKNLDTTFEVKPLSALAREGQPLSVDMSSPKVTLSSKEVNLPLDSTMSFFPKQPTGERLLGTLKINRTQESQSVEKGAMNTAFVLDTPNQENRDGDETLMEVNPKTSMGADPSNLATSSEVVRKFHSLVFPSKPPRRPQSVPLEHPTENSMLAAKVLGWHPLDKNASEITPLRSGVPTENISYSVSIEPNGITQDEREMRPECITPSEEEFCDGYMNPEDDTLSLEFFVPVKKTYIRLHRRTFIAFVLKYSIFFFTFLFWFASLSGIAFGTWMLTRNSAVIDDITDVFLDPYALLCVVSGIIFLVAFFGCVGVLRENVFLLKIFHISLTAVLVLEALLGTLVFVFYAMPDFRHAVKVGPEEVLKKAVKQYFDDDGMRNWIDLVQKEFQCCGVSLSDHGYLDWQENVYFNCSDLNRSVYRCSVPLSCCIFEAGDMINYMCGAGIIKKEWTHIQRYINTKGCMKTFGEWLSKNDALIGYTALGIFIPQVLGVVAARYYIKNLRKQRERCAN